MDINERLEELRAQRDDLRTQVDDVQRSYELVCERIMGIEEALNDMCVRDAEHRANGEAKPPRRKRRDIRGLVQEALNNGAAPIAASLAPMLDCRPSQVEAALKSLE